MVPELFEDCVCGTETCRVGDELRDEVRESWERCWEEAF
jgi:hypothetical protein